MKIKRIQSYLLSICGLLLLIIIAVFMPDIIFSIQDGYQMAGVETESRDDFDVQTSQDSYSEDMASRMQNIAEASWGTVTVSIVEQSIDVEVFRTLMNEIMTQEYITILLSLTDYEAAETLERISIENVKVCDRYVVYGEDYKEGILLTFWYIKIYLPNIESYIEFIVDSETYSIYYAELNAETSVNYVVYSDDEPAEEVQVNLISDVSENMVEEDMATEKKSDLLLSMAQIIPSYCKEYYLQYYGINPEEAQYMEKHAYESVTATEEFITTTYMLTYDDSKLLFRFYAGQGSGETINMSIGLPFIRQLIQE